MGTNYYGWRGPYTDKEHIGKRSGDTFIWAVPLLRHPGDYEAFTDEAGVRLSYEEMMGILAQCSRVNDLTMIGESFS